MAGALIDTCIAIDHLRGRAPATRFLLGLPQPPFLSAVTVAELYAGVRDGPERTELDAFLIICKVHAVETDIAREAGLLRRRYHRSHGLDIADALIAATAIAHGLELATLNRKHFPMLSSVVVPY